MMKHHKMLFPAILATIISTGAVLNAETLKIKVMSYNICHCEGMDKKIDMQRIADIIRKESPDVVALQEVDKNTARSGADINEAEKLAQLTAMNYVFGKSIPYKGGEYGNAVLSRYTITNSVIHTVKDPKENRSVIEADLKASPDTTLKVFATHMSLYPAQREETARLFNSLLPDATPGLACGDFNDYVGNPSAETLMKILSEKWVHTTPANDPLYYTYPSTVPKSQIDFILFDHLNKWRILEAKVLDEPVASDHRPLVITLELTHP